MTTAETQTVLIVDDDETVLRSTERLLRTSGYVVEVARSARDGLALLQSVTPDAALVDWSMPEMDGLQFCREVRARYGSKLTLIMVTGRGDPDSLAVALRGGADDVIQKPWALPEMLAKLEVSRRRSARPRFSLRAELEAALHTPGGELVVRDGTIVGRVLVQAGQIAWVDVTGTADSLQDIVSSYIELPPEEWRSLFDECRRERLNLFDALVSWNIASLELVTACVRHVIGTRLELLNRLGSAESMFLPGARPHRTEIMFSLDQFPELSAEVSIEAALAPPTIPPAPAKPLPGLPKLAEMKGMLAYAVIDSNSSEVLLGVPASPELEARVRAHSRALRNLATDDRASEMLSLSDGVWHLLARSSQRPSEVYYLSVQDGTTPLAMARLTLTRLARGLG